MNAKTIITDTMTLDEKIDAIDEAIKTARKALDTQSGQVDVSIETDPSEAFICDGCE